ncbi:uncharacterized protein G2W53_033179 [Senna tora]|uniref:Uncharacterized protein n=1 Tax=Senna tora TaxID=362788 RepID=A0A834SYT2_9FABA|nr:uncharacterized protein G2W53_033179 [Senna tora]
MIDFSCGGIFLDKNPDEAWDLFEHLSENSQQRATSSRIGTCRQVGNKGGIYEVSNTHDLSNQVASLSKKFDQLMNKLLVNFSNSQDVCVICASPKHCATDCPSASSYPEYMEEHVNVTQGFKQDNPYSNTYNPGWRNHPNFSWRQQNSNPQSQQVNPNGLVNPSTYESPKYPQPAPQSFQSSGIDHNFQNQVLSALKNLDPMRQLLDSHTQSIAKLETQVGQLANTIARRDEGKLPSFPMENPRGQTYQEETKAVTTLRSGKIIDDKVGLDNNEANEEKEKEKEFLREKSQTDKNSERTWYMVRTLIYRLQENLSYNSPGCIVPFSSDFVIISNPYY